MWRSLLFAVVLLLQLVVATQVMRDVARARAVVAKLCTAAAFAPDSGNNNSSSSNKSEQRQRS